MAGTPRAAAGYDTPGQATRVPFAGAASTAINLEIANMDFSDFVDMESE